MLEEKRCAYSSQYVRFDDNSGDSVRSFSSCLLYTSKSDQKIAKAILGNTKDQNQQILMLDSMQSTTAEDVSNGTTYLSVMENNLNVLKEALK